MQRVWNYYNVLRDDGVSNSDYLEQQCGRSVRARGRLGLVRFADASPLRAWGRLWMTGRRQGEALTYDPLKHHRRSVRLAGYDYAAPGAYFVTVVVQGRTCLLGEVTADGQIWLSVAGEMVQAVWQMLPRHFRGVRLDAFVVMPNHLHGIIVVEQRTINAGRGEASATDGSVITERLMADASPLRAHGTQRGSLGAMMQNFKAVSTRRLNTLRHTAGVPFWQRNYWEHVARDAAELDRIREYIQGNPARWAADPLRPAA